MVDPYLFQFIRPSSRNRDECSSSDVGGKARGARLLVKTDESISALWAGVIHQAIADMDSPYSGVRQLAKDWMFSPKSDAGSFVWICDMIDLDADRIRLISTTRAGRKALKLKHLGQDTVNNRRSKPPRRRTQA